MKKLLNIPVAFILLFSFNIYAEVQPSSGSGSPVTLAAKSGKAEAGHDKHNKEHQISVGNEKAAASGSTEDEKTIKEKKPHGKGHEKRGKGNSEE